MQIAAECYASTTVKIATAMGFFSRMCSLQSLEMLESEHQLVTASSVESWPGVLQMVQKHIRGCKIGREAEMGFPVREAYSLPTNATSLVGSVMANLRGSHYPLHMAMVEASSQRVLIVKAFSIPMCLRLARLENDGGKICHSSERSHYWRFLVGACKGRAENQEGPRNFKILEPMLGKEVSERSVLCRKHNF